MTDLEPASVRAVAEKDFRDAVRSRGLLLLTAVFVVFFAASSYFFADRVTDVIQQQAAQQGQQANVSSDTYLQALTNITRLLIPLVGIVVAYASVIGERESGTLKLLLSLPHSRLDVVVGKFFGRSGVVALPVLLGFVVAAPTFPVAGVTFQALNYVGFALATALVGVVFVAIALGASAVAPTSRRAVVGVVGFYALLTLLWGQVVQSAVRLISQNTDVGTKTLVELYFVAHHLSPIAAYKSLVASLVQPSTLQARASVVSSGGLQQQLFAQQLGSVPPYLSDPALVVYLLVWMAVPLAIGYYAFEGADL